MSKYPDTYIDQYKAKLKESIDRTYWQRSVKQREKIYLKALYRDVLIINLDLPNKVH